MRRPFAELREQLMRSEARADKLHAERSAANRKLIEVLTGPRGAVVAAVAQVIADYPTGWVFH